MECQSAIIVHFYFLFYFDKYDKISISYIRFMMIDKFFY